MITWRNPAKTEELLTAGSRTVKDKTDLHESSPEVRHETKSWQNVNGILKNSLQAESIYFHYQHAGLFWLKSLLSIVAWSTLAAILLHYSTLWVTSAWARCRTWSAVYFPKFVFVHLGPGVCEWWKCPVCLDADCHLDCVQLGPVLFSTELQG